ncbi:type II toxin-antitoxin system VapC family toxin [Halosimplex halophilum]|uniref:type II toxin-antitoxin system VapC family toxin n=1 Tax=Halosimplex halophilum TaxID=2559572 RepID=UPI00107F3EF2|nr:PIN domain-containing protein [Halosimplex halophilum]
MTPVAAVDTSVLVGRADADDRHHDAATAIVDGIDRGRLPTGRVTNYVVLEMLNWIHGRRRHEAAIALYASLKASAGFEIHHAPRKDYDRAIDLFETYDGLAFGDATVVAHLQREGIEHLYSFDDDFDAVAGVTRLATPDDPF